MRIFVAGATGVVGRALVPLLVADGHDVTGMTRSRDKLELLVRLGAHGVVCDAFDADAVREAVVAARAEVVVNELTDLPAVFDPAALAANARIRREGTRNLVAGALAAGATRFASQSIAFESGAETAAAVAELERLTLETDGIDGLVLRHGRLYGPGTYHPDDLPPPPRVSVAHAADATRAALASGTTGVVEVVDR